MLYLFFSCNICAHSFYYLRANFQSSILVNLIGLLGRYARLVDHLAVRDVAQGAPLGGGSTLHYFCDYSLSLGLLCLF